MPDFNFSLGQSHMLTHFITEEKWKFEKARQIKKAQFRKEKFLRNNVVKMTTDELLKIQSEIKTLSNDFNAYYADWQGAKVRFVKLTEKFTNVAAPSQQEFLKLKPLFSKLKNMPAPLMIFSLLKKMLVPEMLTPFQLLKKLPGHPLVVRLKKLKKPGKLHQLRLRKFNQIPQLLSQSPQLLRQGPQHLYIWPRAKGLQASRLPLVSQRVPQLHQIIH